MLSEVILKELMRSKLLVGMRSGCLEVSLCVCADVERNVYEVVS